VRFGDLRGHKLKWSKMDLVFFDIGRGLVISLPVSFALLVLIFPRFFNLLVKRLFVSQLTKTTNSSRVTVGFCHLSLFRGIFEARDIVFHTPGRSEWGWDSPLVGRCGHMRVSFSVLSFLPLLRYPAKEVYSVCVSDIQAFVEKRANVSRWVALWSLTIFGTKYIF